MVVWWGDQTLVGNGHAMGTVGQVFEDLLRSSKGWLDIDHPNRAERSAVAKRPGAWGRRLSPIGFRTRHGTEC